MPDYSSDCFFLQTTILTLIGPLFRNNLETAWAPEAKSGQGRLSPKGPPFHFFTFSRKPTKPDVPKGFPLWIFSKKKFNVSKGSPLRVFFKFCNWMYVNKSQRVPFYIFRHYVTFLKNRPLRGTRLFLLLYPFRSRKTIARKTISKTKEKSTKVKK